MSLRGSETTEAISESMEKNEIAALPSVARNDRKGIVTRSREGGEIEHSSPYKGEVGKGMG